MLCSFIKLISWLALRKTESMLGNNTGDVEKTAATVDMKGVWQLRDGCVVLVCVGVCVRNREAVQWNMKRMLICR